MPSENEIITILLKHRRFSAGTTYEMFASIALFFPKLVEQLSRLQRRPNNRGIFDAAALGVGYMARFGEYQITLSKAPTDAMAEQPQSK
ncbi:MAG TPA: hypothetical protein VNW97_18670 [Candidatus Saccharimonadales bacterium]|jgi:hypothetical protein|nr:hypothetical protein [Candidatus Saccharimonadales bacterium]